MTESGTIKADESLAKWDISLLYEREDSSVADSNGNVHELVNEDDTVMGAITGKVMTEDAMEEVTARELLRWMWMGTKNLPRTRAR